MTVNAQIDKPSCHGHTAAVMRGLHLSRHGSTSHINNEVVAGGSITSDAETKNCQKYLSLAPFYEFVAIAIETYGAWGDSAVDFLCELGLPLLPLLNRGRSPS